MKIGVRLFLLGAFVAMLVLALSPAALGDAAPAQVVTVSWSSGCTGFLFETLDGTVTGCTSTPAGTRPQSTGIGGAANGSVVFSDTNQGDGGGDGPIWLVSPGGSPIELDSSPDDFAPSISWDGSRVVFARFDPATVSSDLYTVNADGSDLTLVASGGGINLLRVPVFSPDGGSIAYACGPANNELGLGGCGPLTDGTFRDSGIMRMSADGSDPGMIVIGAGAANQPVGPNTLSWSSDGQSLTMDGDDGNIQQVFEYRTDGSDLFNNGDPTRQITHETDLFGAWLPQFCGDSAQILFMKTVDDSGNQGNFPYLINTDGTGRQELSFSSEGYPYGTCDLPANGDAPPPLVDMTHITVPAVATLDVGTATSELEADNLTVGTVSYVYSATVGENHIVSQSPSAGEVAHRTQKQGPPVDLVVSRGPAPTAPPPTVMCVVPKVKGKTLKTTGRALSSAHCKVGKVKRAYSRTFRKGRVMSATPGAGRQLPDGSKVALSVSKGKRSSR